MWFSDEAIKAWAAEPRATRGRQPWYSPLAILTALTLHAMFRLAFRQTEGLIGSVIALLGLALRVPDHTTLSRRSATLEVPRPLRPSTGAGGEAVPLHLLVDSTRLELCGPGEWLVEKHGARTRRSWRKLHLGIGADTGQIVAASLTTREVDDSAEVDPWLGQVAGPVASVTGDGGYDQDGVHASVAARRPEAAETAPTQRDRPLQHIEPRGSPDIAEHGCMGWQKASGYTGRALAEVATGRWKQVIGDGCARIRTSVARPRWRWLSTCSIIGWSWGARTRSAPPDPKRDWGSCAITPDLCTTLSTGRSGG